MLEESDLDGLIDSALSTYGHAGSGLEQRVLARVGAEPAPASRPRLIWAIALAAAACVLLVFILTHAMPARAPQPIVRKTPSVQPAPQETARVESRRPPQRSEASHRGRPEQAAGRQLSAALPRQEVFPTPRPLSPEERALANFAAQAPQADRDSFVEGQKQADAPIAIADLQIAPIQIPPLDAPQPGTN